LKWFRLKFSTTSSKGIRGDSPLHIASSNCSSAVIDELIRYGACIDTLNHDQETALHIASKQNRTEICEILLQYSKLLNKKSLYGKTPLKNLLDINLQPSKLSLATLLIQSGCEINDLKFTIAELNSNLRQNSSVLVNNQLTCLEYLMQICESTFKTPHGQIMLIKFIVLLFDSGYKFDFNRDFNLVKSVKWLFNSSKTESMRKCLLFRMRRPESLANLCRFEIRSALKKPITDSIETLQIPFVLKDFLNLR
jgi:hypothetical protein